MNVECCLLHLNSDDHVIVTLRMKKMPDTIVKYVFV